MPNSTLPLFPTDDGWPYPDGGPELHGVEFVDDGEPDLDEMDLRLDPHAYDTLDDRERVLLFSRFGLGGTLVVSMSDMCRELHCTHDEASALLDSAVDKVRRHLTTTA